MDTNNDGTPFEPPRPMGPPQFDPQVFFPPDGEPMATLVPASHPGKRSTGKMVGGLIAVVALVGAGGFGISKIVAGNSGLHGSRLQLRPLTSRDYPATAAVRAASNADSSTAPKETCTWPAGSMIAIAG